MSVERVRIGFLPLVDAALPIVAREQGFAEAEGLDLLPVRDLSWATVRDRLLYGRTDAAHLIAPLAIATALGRGRPAVPMAVPFVLGLNGNAITLSPALADAVSPGSGLGDPRAVGERLAAVARARLAEGRRLRLGVVHRYSSHNFMLRYWLAACGVMPDAEVETVTISPPFAAESLAAGEVDGICVGEPWNSVAVDRGVGRIVLVTAQIWKRGVEKVLAARADRLAEAPDLFARLIRALHAAAAYFVRPDTVEQTAATLARPEYLDGSAALIRCAISDRIHLVQGEAPLHVPDFMFQYREAANFPWRSQAAWLYSQLVRWERRPYAADEARIAEGVFRPDVYRGALAGGAALLPGASSKLEGGLERETGVGSTQGRLLLGSDRFFDGRAFDPDDTGDPHRRARGRHRRRPRPPGQPWPAVFQGDAARRDDRVGGAAAPPDDGPEPRELGQGARPRRPPLRRDDRAARARQRRLLRLGPASHRGLLRRQQTDEGVHRLGQHRHQLAAMHGECGRRPPPRVRRGRRARELRRSRRRRPRRAGRLQHRLVPSGRLPADPGGPRGAGHQAGRHRPAPHRDVRGRRPPPRDTAGQRRRADERPARALPARGAGRRSVPRRLGPRPGRFLADDRGGRRRLVGGAGVGRRARRPPSLLRAVRRPSARRHPVQPGINQSLRGTDQVNAIINLHLATGRIGTLGAAPFSITGQPNAMGGREVGGLASTLAAHRGFAPEDVDDVRRFWSAPRMATRPGLKAVDLFREVEHGRIKALWIMATNPAVSMPDAGAVRAALAACPFVVVSDVIAETDTSVYADVRLPAAAWGEKDGTVTNSERTVSRQRPFLPMPGEARPDWWIVAEVGRRMGWADAFTWRGPDEIYREHARLSRYRNRGARLFELGGDLSAGPAGFDAMAPFRWGGTPFADGRYPTPDGRARLVTVTPAAAPAALPAWPMTLNTGRYRDQWHTMTRTGLSPRLARHREEPLVEVHSADAAALYLADGDLARVATPQGDSVFRVALTDGQRPGELFVPIHWTDRIARGGRVGLLPRPLADPHSGQPGFKATPARIERVAADWHGFLVLAGRDAPLPDCLWATRVAVAGGTLFELAGTGDPAALDHTLPRGERLEVADRARRTRRIAVLEDGRLVAALFVARERIAPPPRDWLVGQLAMPVGPWVLAGRAPGRQVDRGPIVCACFDVGLRTIAAAIAEQSLADVPAIGAALRAGTNCGSCRPALARLLNDTRSEAAHAAE